MMSNAQLYILLAPSLLSLFGVFFSAFTANQRLDDIVGRLNRIEHTQKGLQGGLTRFYGEQRRHDGEIATLKERLK